MVGPKVGLNLAWIAMDRENISETVEILPRRGIQLGGMVNFSFNEHWSIQPELLFTQKGRTFRYLIAFGLQGDRYTVSRSRSNYLELPLLLKYTFSAKERWRIFLATGPSIGYWASASTAETNDTQGVSSSSGNTLLRETIKEDIDLNGKVGFIDVVRWEIGANLESGVTYHSSVGQFTIGVRYNVGITRPVEDRVTLGRTFDYNRVLSLTIGYLVEIN